MCAWFVSATAWAQPPSEVAEGASDTEADTEVAVEVGSTDEHPTAEEPTAEGSDGADVLGRPSGPDGLDERRGEDDDFDDIDDIDRTASSAPAEAEGPANVEAPDPALGTTTFDRWESPWGPGRSAAGERFRSAATPPPPGSLHWTWGRVHVAIGAQYFARAELRDNASFNRNVEDLDFRVDHRARLSLRVSAYDRVGVVLEFQDVRFWGSEATVGGLPSTRLHQGYVDLKVASWLDLRVGRQELGYGEDRLLGVLDWAQAARAFNGLFARVTAANWLTIDAFGMLLHPKIMGPEGDYSGAYLSGLYGRARADFGGVDLYLLGHFDDSGRREANDRRATLGARAFLDVAGLNLMGEGAYQVGRRTLYSLARDESVSAGAFAARARYTFRALWGSPYVAVEGLGATGDGDPTDGVHRTFDQLFPTAHVHLGYIDYVAWQNVVAARGTLGWRPFGAHVWVDVHRFHLWDRRGVWFDASGARFLGANPANEHSDMGTEVDVSVTIPLFAHVSIAGALAIFVPGRAAAPTFGPATLTPSTWAFIYLRSQI